MDEGKIFNMILLSCIIFIVVYGLYNIFCTNKRGTWSTHYFYPRNINNYHDRGVGRGRGVSKGELECRRVLEKYFKRSFKNHRPLFMNNEVTNNNLELDCYCPSLGLAVEYSGQQHYKYIPYFHKNFEAFRNQQYRDVIKRNLCEKNGIVLIEVSYKIKIEDIEKYLLNELKKKGFEKYFI